MEEIIKEELNVKDIVFRENEEELVEYSAKANYRMLGKSLGKDMKAASARIESLTMPEIQSLLEGATLSLDLGVRVFDLTQEGVNIIRNEKENLKVLNEGSLTVALDSELTEDLIREGVIRDLVRSIQNLRKEMGLMVTDRIELYIFGSEQLKATVEAFQEHLTSEILATYWHWQQPEAPSQAAASSAPALSYRELECGQENCFVSVRKINTVLG